MSSSPSVCFFSSLFDSFNFIYYRCTTTFEEWNFGSFYFKRLMCIAILSQSVQNIFRDSHENIVPYYSQKIRLKINHYTCCLNFSSVGKRLKKSMQQVLALRQSRYFLDIWDNFKNMSKAQRFNFTYRAYGKQSRWRSYKNNNIKCKYR